MSQSINSCSSTTEWMKSECGMKVLSVGTWLIGKQDNALCVILTWSNKPLSSDKHYWSWLRYRCWLDSCDVCSTLYRSMAQIHGCIDINIFCCCCCCERALKFLLFTIFTVPSGNNAVSRLLSTVHVGPPIWLPVEALNDLWLSVNTACTSVFTEERRHGCPSGRPPGYPAFICIV